MKRIANLIQTKLPNYKDFALCAYNMPYNHQWYETKYNNWAEGTSFQKLKDHYSSLPLNRQMIMDLFQKGNYYDGFLCAMIWGNIGANLSGKECFTSVFNEANKSKIEQHLINVIDLLQNKDVVQAYLSLSNGGVNKIDGVGESFFTKLLYFAGGSICDLNPQPLIYDRVMHGVYKEFQHKIGFQTPQGYVNEYMDYCTKMDELRNLLSLPTAGHVEALLFSPGISNYIFH